MDQALAKISNAHLSEVFVKKRALFETEGRVCELLNELKGSRCRSVACGINITLARPVFVPSGVFGLPPK